jgi:hypothetical protein
MGLKPCHWQKWICWCGRCWLTLGTHIKNYESVKPNTTVGKTGYKWKVVARPTYNDVILLCLGIVQLWRWRQYVPPKYWHPPMSVHGTKTHKNDIFLTAVKTSNLTGLLTIHGWWNHSLWGTVVNYVWRKVRNQDNFTADFWQTNHIVARLISHFSLRFWSIWPDVPKVSRFHQNKMFSVWP